MANPGDVVYIRTHKKRVNRTELKGDKANITMKVNEAFGKKMQ